MSETPEIEFNNEKMTKEQLLDQAFSRILKIVEVLRSMGFRINDHLINKDIFASPTACAGVPLVADGSDSIRASYDDYYGDLRIGFTNGLENPNNPRRQEVVERLKSEGLWNQ